MVGGPSREEKRVLLVDDDMEFRALLATVLRARDLRVFEAGSAATSTLLLENERPDLVIVDGMLPDLPGVRLIERVREENPDIIVVFLSAFWRDLETFEYLTRDLHVSLVAYKPIEPMVFAENILELLDPVARRSDSVRPLPSSLPDAARETLRSRMDVLREEYARELPNKLDELESLIETAKNQPEAAASAASSAHRLRGTAGAYGFKLVGTLAGQIEDLLCEYEASPSQARRDLWNEIGRALIDARLASRAPESTARSSATPTDSSQAGAFLFVDDDADARRTATALLKKQLLDVVVASSGPEALHKAASTKLVAAIVDVHLGEESGFDLCAQLRGLPHNEDLPLVVVSADQSVATRVAATHAGASLFIEKPFQEEAFSMAVQQLLDEAVAHRSRVLILEDDRAFSDHAELLLQAQDIETRAIANPAALPETLETFQPDLLLLDIELSNTSGVDICRALRMSLKWQTLPILMMTAHVDDDTRIESFRAGANDFISKPVLEEEFYARVDVQLMHARLLRERAERDPLSGLLLRRPFLEAFEQRLSESRRYERPLALAIIDIDHFKQVNDQFGHATGDAVIAGLGQLLRQRFRNEDLRCRWGGEEFIVVLPGQDAGLLERALGRVLLELSEMEFTAGNGEQFSVSASAGVASHPDDGLSAQALIRRADARLYQAKRDGRNRIVAAAYDMDEVQTSRFRKLHSA